MWSPRRGGFTSGLLRSGAFLLSLSFVGLIAGCCETARSQDASNRSSLAPSFNEFSGELAKLLTN
jgi:hypothetical protein